ncbi:protein of unknown function [Acidithiobacillus ferrivorans]|uniref:Uncharacterized protein n=1 Tax=Acidithiobacillus ferrivorans TaxID=160808 RepID=A0A060UPI0_9PROT|nr:hypothetical protein AFERRI_400258 [Acidithiobacillus ferrivorans]SMH64505.1 protein of unknown function [Acidithiobacillus ferrivorans]
MQNGHILRVNIEWLLKCRGGQSEGRPRANSHASHMGSRKLSLGYHRPHHIPRLESPGKFGHRFVSHREAVFIQPRPLPLTVPLGSDQQGPMIRIQPHGGTTFSGTRGVNPVRLLVVLLTSVPLRAPAAANLHRQPGLPQRHVQSPAGAVDGCGVLQRGFRLTLYLLQSIFLMGLPLRDLLRILARERFGVDQRAPTTPFAGFQKQVQGLLAFFLVAAVAGDGEIAHPVGAALACRIDVRKRKKKPPMINV